MNRDHIVALLHRHQEELFRDFGVAHLALFGSAARDELRGDSDIDLLVSFAAPATFDGYFALKDRLETLLQRQVDLVTEEGLKPRARQQVEREMVRVA